MQSDAEEPEAIKDARRDGAPAHVIAAIAAALERRDGAESDLGFVGVWPEHAPIVEAFLAVSGQWRTASIGGGLAGVSVYWLGLDYAAVRAGLDGLGIAVTRELWAGLTLMEGAARTALNST